MIRRPPRSTLSSSSAASDVYKRQAEDSIGIYAQTERVIQLFKNAAEIAQNDADPFSALGVLCNLSREYDDAAGWFRKALQLKPSSHSLWNKLGATQANGSRSKDALHAYNQALALKPTYGRAWINTCLLYTSPSPRDRTRSRMPSSA
eukprot:TRINITY_DN12942_c0_g1_i4.p1 TRINITY_DN12942_c0_g1~~TRINITY_DN12942_c0_g1_i4.p1  ORF type:complete len:148 (-),score=42.22 TRINITY_DN12942_c0_g1_i4:46-489(-)